jgi:hypothetical protein
MPARRRSNKRRDALSDDAIAFLEGRPSFTQFKDDAFLADLLEKYGDTSIATWDEDDRRPRAIAD